MSTNFCFGISSLLTIATFLWVCPLQSSKAGCDIESDLQANGPSIVYNKVDHSVKGDEEYKLSLLLYNNSSLSARIRFELRLLKRLYKWIISDKNDNFFARFEQEDTNPGILTVDCTKTGDKNNNNDDSLVRNLTICFLPNSPKEEGVIKCNKTTHTHIHKLYGCTISSCSLVKLKGTVEFPENIEIVWVSVLPDGSKADPNLHQLKVQYDDEDLNVTSCTIESYCPVNSRPTTNTSSNTTGAPNAETEHNRSATVVGVSVGLVVTAVLVTSVILGGVILWKRRSKVKSTFKSSMLSFAPTARSDVIRRDTDLPTASASRPENNSPIRSTNANLASDPGISEDTGFDCNPPNSKAVAKKRKK